MKTHYYCEYCNAGIDNAEEEDGACHQCGAPFKEPAEKENNNAEIPMDNIAKYEYYGMPIKHTNMASGGKKHKLPFDGTDVGGIIGAIMLLSMLIFFGWVAIGGQAYCQKQTEPSWLCEDPKVHVSQSENNDEHNNRAPKDDNESLINQCLSGIDLYGLCGMYVP